MGGSHQIKSSYCEIVVLLTGVGTWSFVFHKKQVFLLNGSVVVNELVNYKYKRNYFGTIKFYSCKWLATFIHAKGLNLISCFIKMLHATSTSLRQEAQQMSHVICTHFQELHSALQARWVSILLTRLERRLILKFIYLLFQSASAILFTFLCWIGCLCNLITTCMHIGFLRIQFLFANQDAGICINVCRQYSQLLLFRWCYDGVCK